MYNFFYKNFFQLTQKFYSLIINNMNKIKIAYLIFICCISLIHIADVFADTAFNIPGDDKSENLTDANDLAATIVGFAENVFSKVIALFCAISGVHRCAKKKTEEGIPLLVGAVGLTFVGRIMDTIATIFGKK